MTNRTCMPILLLAVVAGACDPIAPDTRLLDPAASQVFARAAARMPAAGTFSQTAITGLEVRTAGPNTILEQTDRGLITGTLSGEFEDDLRVVIHPNGRFKAQFTIICECRVDGRDGVVTIVAGDTGELTTPELAAFAGRAVITGATGELEGLKGELEIEGTVDVPSGLATYAYSGDIHFEP